MLTKQIPAYAYETYQDDEDILAFFTAFNVVAQDYLDTIRGLNLPIYTNDPVAGQLLDWVAEGLYDFTRPVLPSISSAAQGPVNTFMFNELMVNGGTLASVSPPNYVTDDLFRRVITWHFFKGDGKVFNIIWLKRRIMRFLFGVNGVNFNVDQTYRVSVNIGADRVIHIIIVNGIRTTTASSMLNGSMLNEVMVNGEVSFTTTYPEIPAASLLELAFATGILETPFMFTFTVTQGILAEIGI